MDQLWELLKWLVFQWWFWVGHGILLGLLWYGFFHRVYKMINGIPYIKEGFGKWEPLEEHIRRKHPKEYEELRKSRKG